MKHRILCFICVIAILFQICPVAFAHGRKEHDKHIEKVLFGRDNYHASLPAAQRDALDALECAAYLCPDQFNGNGSEDLSTLKNYGVLHLPESIDEINFTANYDHRKYTHLGWIPAEHPERGNWDKRKEMLLATVNKVFDFGWQSDFSLFGFSISGYADQCDAMAALLYYIHILGDVEHLDTYEKYRKEGSYVFPLVRTNPGENNPDIIYDLTVKYLPKLFSSQIGSDQYNGLQTKLQSVASDARHLVGSTGGINNEEKYSDYRKYTLKVLDILSAYIPTLLMNESFFKGVFGGL